MKFARKFTPTTGCTEIGVIWTGTARKLFRTAATIGGVRPGFDEIFLLQTVPAGFSGGCGVSEIYPARTLAALEGVKIRDF